MPVDSAYDLAKAEGTRKVRLWDRDEDAGLMGVAQVVVLAAG